MAFLLTFPICFFPGVIWLWWRARPHPVPDPWASLRTHHRCMAALAPQPTPPPLAPTTSLDPTADPATPLPPGAVVPLGVIGSWGTI
jgi:hypothetical protein